MPLCKTCHAEIEFVTLGSGKQHPVNARPEPYWCPLPGSTVVLEVVGKPPIIVRVPTDRPLATVRESHFATCPDAAEHRKRR